MWQCFECTGIHRSWGSITHQQCVCLLDRVRTWLWTLLVYLLFHLTLGCYYIADIHFLLQHFRQALNDSNPCTWSKAESKTFLYAFTLLRENFVGKLSISDFLLQCLTPTLSLSFLYKYFTNPFQIWLANGQNCITKYSLLFSTVIVEICYFYISCQIYMLYLYFDYK